MNRHYNDGVGSTILGFAMIFLCFVITIITFQRYEIYNADAEAQILADIVSDGATVYAQTPTGVNEARLNEMSDKLLEANQNYGIASGSDGFEIELVEPPMVTAVREREGITDTRVNFNFRYVARTALGEYQNATGSTWDGQWGRGIQTQILAFSRIPDNITVPETDQDIINATLSRMLSTSKQHAAIKRALDFYGWAYSGSMQWEEGARSFSSFIISAFEEANFFSKDGNAKSIWNEGDFAGYLTEIDSYPVESRTLKPGDILIFSSKLAVKNGEDHGIGNMAIYLGNYGGIDKVYGASRAQQKVCVYNLYGTTGEDAKGNPTDDKLIAYIRFPGPVTLVDSLGDLMWPLPNNRYITSSFGLRTGIGSRDHKGIDIGADFQTPIYSATDGVCRVGCNNSAGFWIDVYAPDGSTIEYMHMFSWAVPEEGAYVKAGDLIGYVGSTGTSDGPHLHFGIKNPQGQYVDPAQFFDGLIY